MPVAMDIIGHHFGRLTVVSRGQNTSSGKTRWLCECLCGGIICAVGGDLQSCNTKSCGCLQREWANAMGKRNTTHGDRSSRVYSIWMGMKGRCSDEDNNNYGGRGIKVCDRWGKFENFLKDMGWPPTSDHQIDRIDNDGGYSKSNCRWSTPKEQSRNKRENRLLSYGGKSQCLSAWSEETGISKQTLWYRLSRGWSLQKALTTEIKI